MGIANPRPAMRSREQRCVKNTLDRHAYLTDSLTSEGIDRFEASRIAFDIVTTRNKRKKIWSTR